MSCNGIIVMEACEDGLWRLCKNTTGRPPSAEKWIHVSGPYFREAPEAPAPHNWLQPVAAGDAQADLALSKSF
jgi:hypothetical protein